MGLKFDGFVGINQQGDGHAADEGFRFGWGGELIVSQNHGKYFEAASRGNMWVVGTTAMAVGLDTGLSNFATLWNPAGSGVILELARLQLTVVTGTTAPGAFELFYITKAGETIGTLGAFTIFTNIAPKNMLMGSGKTGRARFSQVNTMTIGQRSVYLCGAGITVDTWDPTQTYPPFQIGVDYDGMILLPPGTAISLQSTVATVTTFEINMMYMESPYTGMGA